MDRKTAILMSMGFEIVGVVIFAIYVGQYLDKAYGLNGLGTAGALGLGFAGWLIHVVVVARTMTSSSSSSSSKDSSDKDSAS